MQLLAVVRDATCYYRFSLDLLANYAENTELEIKFESEKNHE